MVRRRRLSTGLWIAVLALGVIVLTLGLMDLALMTASNDWTLGSVMGLIGAVCGGAGCTIVATSGIRSNRARSHGPSEKSRQR